MYRRGQSSALLIQNRVKVRKRMYSYRTEYLHEESLNEEACKDTIAEQSTKTKKEDCRTKDSFGHFLCVKRLVEFLLPNSVQLLLQSTGPI